MLQPIQTLAPAPQANTALGQSDDQVEQLKRYIAALRAQRQPVHSAAQGASNLVGDLLGAATERRIGNIQGARQGGADAYVRALATPGSQPDETSLSTGPTGGPPPTPAIAATPMAGGDDQLTHIAAVVNEGETGRGHNFDAHSLGNISPDTHGSKSYGFMGLNSKTGSAAEFARRYGPDLGITAQPGSPEFDAQWRAAAAQRPEAMRVAQMDHFKQTQLQPVYEDLQRWGIPSDVATDPRVQAYFADRHVQMGKLGLQHAAQAWQASGGDPERFLRNMNQLDGSPDALQRYFPNALAQGVYSAAGHATRLAKRLGGALSFGPGDAQAPQGPNAPDATVQPFVQALAGQQTAQAALPPTSQPAQAGGMPAQPAAPQNEFMQHLSALVHMGYTPTQALPMAQLMVEGRKGFLPQIKVNEWGQIVREAPGQIPQNLGIQPGHPGKPATINGVPGFERPTGPNGSIEFHPVDISMGGGAQPNGAIPLSAAPAAPTPYPIWGDWKTPQDLATYGPRMKAAEAGEIERKKEANKLAVVNDPANQAMALQSATEKKAMEQEAETVGKAKGEAQAEYIKGRKDAQNILFSIGPMKEALKEGGENIITGLLGEPALKFKSLVNSIVGGEPLKGTSEAEVFQKGNVMLATHLAHQLTARPSQFDFKVDLGSVPGLNLSKQASQYMLNVYEQLATMDIRLAQLAEATANKDWPKVRDQFYANHPLLSPINRDEKGNPLPLNADVMTKEISDIAQSDVQRQNKAGGIGGYVPGVNPPRTKQIPPGWVEAP
jgi:hypothetical protein